LILGGELAVLQAPIFDDLALFLARTRPAAQRVGGQHAEALVVPAGLAIDVGLGVT